MFKPIRKLTSGYVLRLRSNMKVHKTRYWNV